MTIPPRTYNLLVHLLIDATELLQLDGAAPIRIVLQEQLIADLNGQLKSKLLEGDAKSVHVHGIPVLVICTQMDTFPLKRAGRQMPQGLTAQQRWECLRTVDSPESTPLHRGKELHPDMDSGDTPLPGSAEDTPKKVGSWE